MTENPSREAIEQVLSALVQEQGTWIARDPVRVRTLLQNAFPGVPAGQSRDVEAVVAAVEAGAYDTLAGASDGTPVDDLVSRLDCDHGLTTDEARWAVTSWAHVAGLPLLGILSEAAVTAGVGASAGGTSPIAPTASYPPPQPQQPYPQPGPAQQPVYPPTQPQQPAYPQPGQGYPQPGAPGGPPPGQPPGYGGGPPGGQGPGGPPPGVPGGRGGAQPALIIGICVLVGVLLIGVVVFFVTRGGGEVVAPGGGTTTTAAPATTKRSTTTTEEDPEDSSTTRSTRRATTTDAPTTTKAPTTTTEAPLEWKTFEDPAGKFSIDFPGPFNLDQTSTNIGGQDVGIFGYVSKARGVEYDFVLYELPPGRYFPNPQAVAESIGEALIKNDVAYVVNKDTSSYAGNPSVFIHTKKPDSESNVRAFVTGNRVYAFYVVGAPDLTKGDFARFQAGLHLK